LISTKELRVTAQNGRVLLSSLSLNIPSGILGVYGPNGSGKSTLLKIISGLRLEHRVEGEVSVEGQIFSSLLNPVERIKKVLYLGSDFRAPFDLTVRELLEMGAVVSLPGLWPELSSRERGRIAEVVESLKLADFLPRFFRTLSDGEKQLVMFARGLVQYPKVLVLDETFSKLDLDKLILVGKTIRRHSQVGTTFIIASHDLNFLSEISDQMMFIKNGKKLGTGSVSEMLVPAILDELYPEISLQVVMSPETGKRKILY
jgi:iron complex transport system ATP-binding protein